MAVYFILNPAAAAVKIGYSASPRDRFDKLQTGSPDGLQLLGQIVGDEEVESEWHRFFSDLRIRREWFRAESWLLDTIADAVGVQNLGEDDSMSHPLEIRAYAQLLAMLQEHGCMAFSLGGPFGKKAHETVQDIIRPVALTTGSDGMERVAHALEAYAEREWPDTLAASAVGGSLDHRFNGMAGWWS